MTRHSRIGAVVPSHTLSWYLRDYNPWVATASAKITTTEVLPLVGGMLGWLAGWLPRLVDLLFE